MRKLPRLHAVTNDEVLALPDFLERASEICLACGAAVHIRSGSLDGGRLTDIADEALRACPDGQVFVNDRADVARMVGVAGLHLPAAGLPVESARSIVGTDCWIGRSAHSADEMARAANERADYVFLGPIWQTSSHRDKTPLGLSAVPASGPIPIIAIGGVNPERAEECAARGAYGVAAISSLWFAADVASAARALSLSFPSE